MSYKMHNYRIDRTMWWATHYKIREFYLEQYPYIAPIREAVSTLTLKDAIDLANKYKEYTCEAQLFHMGTYSQPADQYLVRILEPGYFFMNSFEEQGWPVTRCYYDDRSDVPPEDKPNKEIADWMGEEIIARRYMVVPILDKEDYFDVAWKKVAR